METENKIESKILTIRGQQVMIDRDLAELYGTETKVLNQSVKRNIERFPENFMFQLTREEAEEYFSGSSKSQIETLNDEFSRSQFVTLKLNSPDNSSKSQIETLNDEFSRSQFATLKSDDKRGQNVKYLPYAFTEQGVAMLSGVLKSETAVKMSIQIMNAFVAMRHFLQNNAQVFTEINSIKHALLDTNLHQKETSSKRHHIYRSKNKTYHPRHSKVQHTISNSYVESHYKNARPVFNHRSEKSVSLGSLSKRPWQKMFCFRNFRCHFHPSSPAKFVKIYNFL